MDFEFLRPETSASSEPWLFKRDEGELAVDVYETERALFIKTAIAGIRPEELKITLASDMLTIRGTRHPENNDEGEPRNYLCQECHWGAFSRTILLPAEVDTTRAEANFKSGLLVIRLPKMAKPGEIKFKVEAE